MEKSKYGKEDDGRLRKDCGVPRGSESSRNRHVVFSSLPIVFLYSSHSLSVGFPQSSCKVFLCLSSVKPSALSRRKGLWQSKSVFEKVPGPDFLFFRAQVSCPLALSKTLTSEESCLTGFPGHGRAQQNAFIYPPSGHDLQTIFGSGKRIYPQRHPASHLGRPLLRLSRSLTK